MTMVAAEARQGGPPFEAIVLDAQTGQVLRASNPDVLTYPASLTKMMTLYLTFEALNSGRLRLDQVLPVSYEASSRSPTKLGLAPGDSVAVRDLILGLVTRSANDAAAVLAEALGGSEPAFAERMTAKARQLGMMHTVYRNASGLPDPDQRTTARDMARLALALYYDFPREYRYFSTREFEFRGDIVKTHNHMLEWYEGLDGIKTGYVHASGFNLAASAVRNGRRLIGVIMGGSSARWRDNVMADLLNQGFADVGAGPPANRGNAALIATAAPSAAAAAAQVASATAPASTTANSEPAPREKPGIISNALRHLAPVSHAEASTLAHEGQGSADDWSIQLGAFRSEAAAGHAARKAASLPSTRGKQQQVFPPARGEKPALYRARLTPFTANAAKAACAALQKKKLECSVVRPSTKVASR